MPVVATLISDSALREAVTEQIALMAIGETRECVAWDELSATLDESVKAVLVECACLPDMARANACHDDFRCPVLALGETGNGVGLVTESFIFPIRLGHLMARLRYYLETVPRLQVEAISIGPWRLEPHYRQIALESSGENVRLTEKECALLSYLASSTKPVSREELLATIWGYDAQIDTHTLETHIYQLRRKLAVGQDAGELIVNEQGAYLLKDVVR
ncbi:MAG: winged helix-turn-helix domain-containing protein [Bdellovibrionales bacterium]